MQPGLGTCEAQPPHFSAGRLKRLAACHSPQHATIYLRLSPQNGPGGVICDVAYSGQPHAPPSSSSHTWSTPAPGTWSFPSPLPGMLLACVHPSHSPSHPRPCSEGTLTEKPSLALPLLSSWHLLSPDISYSYVFVHDPFFLLNLIASSVSKQKGCVSPTSTSGTS